MTRMRAWISRLWAMRPDRQRARERDLAAEIEAHLQMHADDNVRAGMAPERARRQAILKLGGIEATKQAYRERRSIPILEHLWQDVRFAVRQLRKNAGFTFTATLMLALGMCASVAIFAFVDAALIRPLPYRDPVGLVGVFETVPIFPRSNLSYLDYLDWKRLNTVFRSLDVFQRSGFALSGAAGVERARGARVSDGFFRTLGIVPLIGRDFAPGEDLPEAPRTVLLSYAAWQNRFAGKPEVLGQTVVLDGVANVIVGVLPREFHFSPVEPAEFWTTLHPGGSCDLRRSCHNLFGVARLEQGVPLAAALANIKAIAAQLERQYPDSNRDQGATVLPLSEAIVGDVRPILLMLLSGAVLLLLIATVNIASLLLLRSEARRREMAVRHALGASTGRLISQFVTEGLVLVAAGSLVGLASAYWAMQLLVRLIPATMFASMSFLHGLGLNPRVIAFAAVIAGLAVLLFSLTPSLSLWFSDTREGLAEGSRGSAGNAWRRIGSSLVVLELATAMVLLVGAGLLGRSLYEVLHVDLGLQPDRLVTTDLAAPVIGYRDDTQIVALGRQLLDRVAALPAVESASISTLLPVGGNGNTTWLRVIGRPYHGEHNEMPQREVSPAYFKTLGATLVRGRYFTEAEDGSTPPVAIVNEAMVRRYFPGEDAIGQHLTFLSDPPVPIEIVGIVADIKEGPLDVATPPVLYVPFSQSPDRYFSILVRTRQDQPALVTTLAALIREIDPAIAVGGGMSMNERISDSPAVYLHRSSAWLVGAFALPALLLGVIGLYGVVAYSVSQRRREIGVRMALGARPGTVYQLVLREAGWLTVLGIAIGLLGAGAGATLMRGLLVGVESWDVATMTGVAAVLGLSALLASFIPARRAASVNPVEALRAE